MPLQGIRSEIATVAPELWKQLDQISEPWCQVALSNLDGRKGKNFLFPKTITDPVVGQIELFEWEVALLDSPMLQRLRGIRQLGMAHLLYPAAVHDRLCHTLGVVEITERMIRSLERNAIYRRSFGTGAEKDVPKDIEEDLYPTRLAALLHDIGHAPFSHATEPIVEDLFRSELNALQAIFQKHFPNVGQVKASEALACVLVLGMPMDPVFRHERFAMANKGHPDKLILSIVARILGAEAFVSVQYLSGIVSGPVDADKLDYMSRDSFFTGLPIGLDADRLIRKLEVVTLTETNSITDAMRERVMAIPANRIYEMGVSLAGQSAYEQMVVGRVMLYERVYYHHKVRCAEAMVRSLFRLARAQNPIELSDILNCHSDDTMLAILSGELAKPGSKTTADPSAAGLAQCIQNRRLYHRAFAFAERYLAVFQIVASKDATERDSRSALWMDFMDDFDPLLAEEEIFKKAKALTALVPGFATSACMTREQVIVDLAPARNATFSRSPLMRTDEGSLTIGNPYFEPHKWSNAYRTQKQSGYVFAPREHVIVIAVASMIYFADQFGLFMDRQASLVCKTESRIRGDLPAWMAVAVKNNLCTAESSEVLISETPQQFRIRPAQVLLPAKWQDVEPTVSQRIAQQFFEAIPGGYSAKLHNKLLLTIQALANIIQSWESSGRWVKARRPNEKQDLQAALVEALRIASIPTAEGTEIAGGESDVIVFEDVLIENKVADDTDEPFSAKIDAPWQARRYGVAMNLRAWFVLTAYKPATEKGLLAMPSRIRVEGIKDSTSQCAVVRLVVPYGHTVPSQAKAP